LRGHRRIAGFHHFIERAALMCGIAFHGFHQIGDEIMPLTQLHVDIGIGLIDPLPHRNQAVIDADGPNNEDDDDGQDDHGRSGHCKLPYSTAQTASSPRSII